MRCAVCGVEQGAERRVKGSTGCMVYGAGFGVQQSAWCFVQGVGLRLVPG